MTRLLAFALVLFAASVGSAEVTRVLGAHEHGVGQLDIAFENGQIAMTLRAPGADIVGFEYAAETAEDRAKVDAAVATLARPLDLFSLPAAAGCSVVEASAALESEEGHREHKRKDEHAHNDHSGHEHDDHDRDDHAAVASHSEFHAEYMLNCADPEAASVIEFTYFETFPNARKLEIQVISEQGATAFEVERDAPQLDLRDMF